MSKFWRSGMIDKKVIREREQAEYINKLQRAILELTREDEYATFYTSDMEMYEWCIKNRRQYDDDIDFDKKTLNEIRQSKGFKPNENNTRTLRQEE